MELKKSVASIVRSFDIRRVRPYEKTELREGFATKAHELIVYLSRRDGSKLVAP
jgi:hypothetical protein